MSNMEDYVGKPLLAESIDRFLAIDNPDIMGYYNYLRQVFINLRNQVPYFQHNSVAVYDRIISRWTNLIEIYNNDVAYLERVNFYWMEWRERNPIHETNEHWRGCHDMAPFLQEEDDDSVITQ